jgi:hypothetical protein
MEPDMTMITIPLRDLAMMLPPGRAIDIAEAGEDARGDLIVLSDTGRTYTIELTRNNVAPYYDEPLPEGKMTGVIASGYLMVTFG